MTRPNTAYAVNKLSQFIHRSTGDNWTTVKHILCYLCDTIDHGLTIHFHSPLYLHAYSDADWPENKDYFTSTSAFIIYLERNPVSWSSKKQCTFAHSSIEAECRSIIATAANLRWISNLLGELDYSSTQTPVIYCDNVGVTNLYSNPVFHSHMKHVALDYRFIHEQVQNGDLRVTHVAFADQLVDALTKHLPRIRFHQLLLKIGLSSRSSYLWGDSCHGKVSGINKICFLCSSYCRSQATAA